jgi:transcriptional regulator with XRE-family HTH domain
MDLDIKEIRKNLGLTQAEMAKILGVSDQTISNWEKFGRIPTPMRAKLENLVEEKSQKRDATDHVGRILDQMEAERASMDADRRFYQQEIQHYREQTDRLISIIEGRVAEERKKTAPSLT